MGQGYTRNDSSNNIANGKVIDAADLDGEFDAIVDAFDASTGHNHDGTAAGGGAITKLGPNQEYEGTGSDFHPKTDDTYGLGTSLERWSELHVSGDANVGDLTSTGATFTGNVTIEKNTPFLSLYDTSETAGERNSIFVASNGHIEVQAREDDGSFKATMARLDRNPASLSSAASVITRNVGDSRYARLTGATFTGAVTLDNGGAQASPTLRFDGTDHGFYSTSDNIRCSIDGIQAAVIEPVGSSMSDDQTIVTREKGDARYAQLSESNTYTKAAKYTTNGLGLLQFQRGGTGRIWGIGTDVNQNSMTFYDQENARVAARIEEDGTSASQSTTIITREKGDNRYIAERGSNSNGEYVRFPDGTQICTATVLSQTSTDVTWTYPASFIAVPVISGKGRDADRVLTSGSSNPTATSATFRVWNIGGTPFRSSNSTPMVAIGRWK